MALGGGPGAWIVTVGNEILIGRIVNTNAAWLARRLTFLGFNVERIVVAPDEPGEVAEEIRRALSRPSVRLVVTTGGLGPTYDDRTLEAVALAAGVRLALNQRAYEMVRAKYEQSGLPMTKEREKMAMLPEGAEPLANPVGMAPGSWLVVGGKAIASLPGVPAEMEAMFEQEVVPRIRPMAPQLAVVDCGLVVVGVPESSLAPYVERAERSAPGVYVKSHPKGHETRGPVLEIRVLASAPTRDEAVSRAGAALAVVRDGAEKLGGAVTEEGCS